MRRSRNIGSGLRPVDAPLVPETVTIPKTTNSLSEYFDRIRELAREHPSTLPVLTARQRSRQESQCESCEGIGYYLQTNSSFWTQRRRCEACGGSGRPTAFPTPELEQETAQQSGWAQAYIGTTANRTLMVMARGRAIYPGYFIIAHWLRDPNGLTGSFLTNRRFSPREELQASATWVDILTANQRRGENVESTSYVTGWPDGWNL